MKHLNLGAAALFAAAFCGSTAIGSTVDPTVVNPTSNVIFIVDESGSMGGEQAFLENTVINALDAGLAAAGVTNRSYGVVGYGGSPATPREVGTGLMNAADTQAALGTLRTSGGFEDGYQAIDFALNNFSYDANAAINFILVTDEDRDVASGTSFDFSSISNALTSQNILLNAVVNANFTSDGGTALGVDSTGDAYVEDGTGGFTTTTNGVATRGAGTTLADYVDLANATGGAAWDLNQIRAGGDTAASFAAAFIDIKVQEIISVLPTDPTNPTGPTDPVIAPVPLPAAGWMLIAGMAGLYGLRRRRAAA